MKRSYDLGPEQVASIDSLAAELGIDKTDVLMNGLRLFRAAVRESRSGNRLGIFNGDRILKEFVGPWCDAEPTPA